MEGYVKLAQLMGNEHTDGHFLIFQKFQQLSAQNLLYLQAEILNIHESVIAFAKDDAESGNPERQKFARDWWTLSSSKDNEQWEAWLQLRSKIKEYYEAVALHQMVSNLPQPHKSDLKFLQQWLDRPSMGNCSLIGADCHIYDRENASGLATLSPRGGDVDPLTRMLLYTLPKIYHYAVVVPYHSVFGKWVKKPEASDEPETASPTPDETNQVALSEIETASTTAAQSLDPRLASMDENDMSNNASFDVESHIFLYRDSSLHHTANFLGTLISSLICIVAIVVLYLVPDMKKRLAIVGLFTAIFSMALSLVTTARRVEIFAATAAFASVQVVFVGSTNSLRQ